MPAWSCDQHGAGALADLVEVQKIKAAADRNAWGELLPDQESTWETHCTAWSEVRLLSGDENNQPTQQVPVRRWALRMRQFAETLAIVPTMRVVMATGEVLNVTWSGDPDRKRRWVEVHATEAV